MSPALAGGFLTTDHQGNPLCCSYWITGSFPLFLVVQMVKNLPAIQETQAQPLGREDPLEKGMATHPSILASYLKDRGAWGSKESDMTERPGSDMTERLTHTYM